MINFEEQIKKADEIMKMLKEAYQPGMPPPPPMDPAMAAQQGMPPGGAPPMDPAMAAQQGMPPPPPGGDPAAQGMPPPGGDPAQMEAMLSEVMSAVEQIAGTLQQQAQQLQQLQAQVQEMGASHQQNSMRTDFLEKALKAPAPMEGVPEQQMM